MKKLFIIGLCIIFSANVQALSFNTKTTIKIGQMCGNDDCNCGEGVGLKEKPEIA
jgi:hypothetical protein